MAPHDMVVVDGIMYIAHGYGFHEVDVSDPYNPVDLSFNEVQMGGHNVMPLSDSSYTATSREVVGGALQIWKRHDDNSYEEVVKYSTGDDHCRRPVKPSPLPRRRLAFVQLPQGGRGAAGHHKLRKHG